MRVPRHSLPRARKEGAGGGGAEIEKGKERQSQLVLALAPLFALLLAANVALFAISIPVGVYTVFFTRLSPTYNAFYSFSNVLLFLGPLLVSVPVVSELGFAFLSLISVYSLFIIIAARQGKGLVSSLRGFASDGFDSFFRNNLLVTIISTGFLVFTASVVDLVETSAGIPVGGISGDPMQLIVGLSIAPLREELGFRVLLIGLTAFLMALGRPLKEVMRAVWRPSSLYDGKEPQYFVKPILAAILAVSSVAFGAVHFLAGGGWDIGKLPEATYAGVVLGYLYIRYGFHVAVLAHWGVDYLGSVYAFFGQGAYGVPWTSSVPFVAQQVVTADLLLLLGPACTILVGHRIMLAAASRSSGMG